MPITCTANELALKEAMEGKEKEARKKAVKNFSTLEKMACSKIVENPSNEGVMHNKFVLKMNRGDKGAVCKHKAHFGVCGNEEVNYQEQSSLLWPILFDKGDIFIVCAMGVDGTAH